MPIHRRLSLLATLALVLGVFPAASEAAASRAEATRPVSAFSRAATAVPTATAGVSEVARHRKDHGHKTHYRPKPSSKPTPKPAKSQVFFPHEVVEKVCNVTSTVTEKVINVLSSLDTDKSDTLTFEEFIGLYLNRWTGGLQTGRTVGRRGLLGSKPAEPEPEVDPYAHTLAKPFICDPDNTTVEDALKVIFNELGGGVDGEGEINTSVDGDPAALFQPIFLATLILKDAIAPTCK